METAALVLGGLLAVACVVFVSRPFLREPGLPAQADRLHEPDAAEQRRLSLAEECDRALAALKELEFDHRTGKVSDEDYQELVGPLRREAAAALRALGAAGQPGRGASLPGEPEGTWSAERPLPSSRSS